jgi:tellurite resistance protein
MSFRMSSDDTVTCVSGEGPRVLKKIVHIQTGTEKNIQLTLVISNSMGPWKKFESTVVRNMCITLGFKSDHR